MPEKFIKNVSGTLTEKEALAESTGAPDAGKIPALGGDGRLHNSMMPPGIGADTAAITASEALAGGDYVNIWDNTGAFAARKADASAAGKQAHGFVLASVAEGNTATVYFEGPNTQVAGQTPGTVFLSTTPGLGTATAPSGSGNVVQRIGVATSATVVNFEQQPPLVLA